MQSHPEILPRALITLRSTLTGGSRPVVQPTLAQVSRPVSEEIMSTFGNEGGFDEQTAHRFFYGSEFDLPLAVTDGEGKLLSLRSDKHEAVTGITIALGIRYINDCERKLNSHRALKLTTLATCFFLLFRIVSGENFGDPDLVNRLPDILIPTLILLGSIKAGFLYSDWTVANDFNISRQALTNMKRGIKEIRRESSQAS